MVSIREDFQKTLKNIFTKPKLFNSSVLHIPILALENITNMLEERKLGRRGHTTAESEFESDSNEAHG